MTMIAKTIRTWINPFKVNDVTNPRIHKTTRMTAIVHNITISFHFMVSNLMGWKPFIKLNHLFKFTSQDECQSDGQAQQDQPDDNRRAGFTCLR